MAYRIASRRSVRTPTSVTFLPGQLITTDDCPEGRIEHLIERGFVEVFTPVNQPADPDPSSPVLTDYDIPLFDPPDVFAEGGEPVGGEGDGEAPPAGPE